jgi:DME family drug/metabolite transporter
LGELLALGSAFCFALTGVLISRGGEFLDRNSGHLLSLIVNAVLNSVVFGLRIALGPAISFSWPGFVYFLAGGAFTMFLGRTLWMRSIQRIGAARAGSFKTAQVLFVFVAAIVLLGETASWMGVIGAVAIIGGQMILATERKEVSEGPFDRVGMMWGIAAAASFAAGNIYRKLGMGAWNEAFAGAAIGALISVVVALLVPGSLTGLARELRTVRGRRGALWFLGVGIASSFSQFFLYAALGFAPVWVVNLFMGMEPMLVMILGLALLRGREVLNARLWASVGLVSVGLIVVALR